MVSDTTRVEVGKQGRIVIPADIRRKLGIHEGMSLAIRIKDGAIELLTDDAIDRRLHAMFAATDRSLSEELIAERRAEAAADAAAEEAELARRARRS